MFFYLIKDIKPIWVYFPYRMEEQGDVFIVFDHYECDDPYYGYNEYLRCVYSSFEKAKESVDSFLEKYKDHPSYDGVDGEPFLTIVQMKFGDSKQNELYNTTDFERKKQKLIEREERRKEYRKKKIDEEEKRDERINNLLNKSYIVE